MTNTPKRPTPLRLWFRISRAHAAIVRRVVREGLAVDEVAAIEMAIAAKWGAK